MSGILDKKSRIIDFVITENGREQIESGDIRYKFASFSDKSIVYTKNHDLSLLKKADITDADFNFIPLEASTKLHDEINPEFDIRNFYTFNGVNLSGSSNIDIDQSGNDHIQNFKCI